MEDQILVQTPNEVGIVTYDIRAALAQATENILAVKEFVTNHMEEGTDFGTIPGAGDRKVLLKPGAEKLDGLFNVRPAYTALSVTENPDTGYAMYRYQADLVNRGTGAIMGSGIGSCNSFEKKYRWRQGQRLCPNCSKAAIIKGKAEYGGGWLCWAKRDGCGAKFEDSDTSITSQNVDQVTNPDIMDTWNTVDKMAQKRAAVAAALTLGCVSDLFTQDLEDFVDGEYTEVEGKTAQKFTKKPPISLPGKTALVFPGKKAEAPVVVGGTATIEELVTIQMDPKIEELGVEWIIAYRALRWAITKGHTTQAWAKSQWAIWVEQRDLSIVKKALLKSNYISADTWEAMK